MASSLPKQPAVGTGELAGLFRAKMQLPGELLAKTFCCCSCVHSQKFWELAAELGNSAQFCLI